VLRKIILLFLYTIGFLLWLTVLYQAKTDFPFQLILVFSVSAVGLASGFGARLAFYDRNVFIRLIAALAALVVGLYGLGYLTQWKMGLGPLEFWREKIDYFEAVQLAGGVIAVLVALNAWHRPAARIRETSASPRPASMGELSARPARAITTSAPSPRVGLSNFLSPGTWVRRSRKKASSRPVLRGRTVGHARQTTERLVVSRPSKRVHGRHRRLLQRKPEVQFSMYQEHKCPYCLEDVKRNDPRGVKECPVCHTLHHADCWAITGMCQVPHMNA
jgi:hypothetical protein